MRSLMQHSHTMAAGQKLTSRVTPESGRKTAVREEALDGEQPALDLAIDFVRLVPGAKGSGHLPKGCLPSSAARHPVQSSCRWLRP